MSAGAAECPACGEPMPGRVCAECGYETDLGIITPRQAGPYPGDPYEERAYGSHWQGTGYETLEPEQHPEMFEDPETDEYGIPVSDLPFWRRWLWRLRRRLKRR